MIASSKIASLVHQFTYNTKKSAILISLLDIGRLRNLVGLISSLFRFVGGGAFAASGRG